MIRQRLVLLVGLALLPINSVLAHAHFSPSSVSPGYVGPMAIQIGHGCGAQATHRVTLYVPEQVGVTSVPKEGWQVSEHKQQNRVSEIQWSGSQLASNQKDEFIFKVTAPKNMGSVSMAVKQECVNGEVMFWRDAAPKSAFPIPTFSVRLDVMEDVAEAHEEHDHDHHDHAGHDHDHSDHAHDHHGH